MRTAAAAKASVHQGPAGASPSHCQNEHHGIQPTEHGGRAHARTVAAAHTRARTLGRAVAQARRGLRPAGRIQHVHGQPDVPARGPRRMRQHARQRCGVASFASCRTWLQVRRGGRRVVSSRLPANFGCFRGFTGGGWRGRAATRPGAPGSSGPPSAGSGPARPAPPARTTPAP
jgi:hypothetical protein